MAEKALNETSKTGCFCFEINFFLPEWSIFIHNERYSIALLYSLEIGLKPVLKTGISWWKLFKIFRITTERALIRNIIRSVSMIICGILILREKKEHTQIQSSSTFSKWSAQKPCIVRLPLKKKHLNLSFACWSLTTNHYYNKEKTFIT